MNSDPEPSVSGPRPPEKPDAIVLIALTVVAAALRLPFLSRFGLWLDEITLRGNVLEPLHENLRTVHFLHFIAVRPGLALADNAFGLRLASAAFGIASVPLAYAAVRRALGRPAALLFACFVAITPWFINYSIDANYYSHMMFWSLASLACICTAIEARRPPLLLLLAPFALAAFFVHPFSAIYHASFGLVLAGTGIVRLVSPGKPVPARSSTARTTAIFAGGAALGLLGLWALGFTPAGRELVRVADRFAEMIELGESPANIRFSWAFFGDFFRRIGPAVYSPAGESIQARLWANGASLLFIAAFLAGAWRAARIRPVYGALLVVPFLVSFGLIFNLKAERYFNVRYFSYLVPLYWLGIAVAGGGLAEWLGGRRGRDERAVRAPTKALAIPALAVAALCLPQYLHLLRTDGRNWDAVMPVLAERVTPGEPVLYTNWAEEAMLPYYQERYGLAQLPTRRLAYTAQRGRLAEYELKDACYRTPSLWFLSSWLEIQSTEAVAWATSHMETAARGESIFSDRYDVTAFYWNRGGRYVLPPRILRHVPAAGDIKGEEFGQNFLFERSMDYELQFSLAPGAPPGDARITLDGSEAPSAIQIGESGRSTITGRAQIAGGERHIGLSGVGAGEIEELRIIPRYPENRIVIPATETARFYPSDYVWSPERAGAPWLCLKRNTFADYEFSVAEAGEYELTLRGLHDRPGPIWLEVRLDDDALGVVQFERDDDTPGDRLMPMALAAGDHTLTVHFLNEGSVAESEEDRDRDAWIDRLEFRPLASGASAADDRIYRPGAETAFLALAADGNPSPRWTAVHDGDLELRVDRGAARDGAGIVAAIPRESRGLLFVSPPIPVGREGLVYYSAVLRAERLLNHSINLKTFLLDRSGERIAEKVVNQEGIYRDTGPVRFVDFQPVPPRVAAYQIAFWVYPNGRRPSTAAGTVRFGDVRIETGSPPPAAYPPPSPGR